MQFPEQSTRSARRAVRVLAGLAAAVVLAACAAPGDPAAPAANAATATAPAGAVPLITVPPSNLGTWYDLGEHQAPWLNGDAVVPASGATVPTRAAGLRSDDGRWLALVIVQQVRRGEAPCPPANGLHVRSTGFGEGSCLRLRRDADFDRWLEQQHPVLHEWVEQQGWATRPRAWVSERVPGAARTLDAHVLLDPALIEPITRSTNDFLAGGRPGIQWARQLAGAARTAAGGGALAVPPFPFAGHLPVRPAMEDEGPLLPAAAEQIVPESQPEAGQPARAAPGQALRGQHVLAD